MDSPILILLLLLLNKDNDVQNPLHSVKEYVNGIKINYKYTSDKIRIVKKIRPYLPSEYSDSVNRSIAVTEKLIKLLEAKDYIQSIDSMDIDKITEIEMEPKDKMLKIVHIIQEEVQNSKMDNLGFALDLVGNIDNYKNMFSLLTTFMKDKKSLNEPNNIMKLMESFLGGNNPKDKEKLKELSKMMELLKVLDTPKKEISNES